MNYVKPQKPLIQDGKGIYPITTIDQVVRADGRRFSENEFNRVFQRNLLRPTLQTTTVNGVTCTNNGDGTYTLNGTNTSTSDVVFNLKYLNYIKGITYKLVGCPSGGSLSSYRLISTITGTPWTVIGSDTGNGALFSINDDYLYRITIVIAGGYTCNNLVFKPMLTTDLNATYDDFVSGFDSLTPDIKMDLLWENANPTSAFAPQTISLDFSNYNLLLIETIAFISRPNSTFNSLIIKNNQQKIIAIDQSSDANVYISYRYATFNDTSITFGANGWFSSNDNHGDYDQGHDQNVPYRIYGII